MHWRYNVMTADYNRYQRRHSSAYNWW
jgi:hypothetical protein